MTSRKMKQDISFLDFVESLNNAFVFAIKTLKPFYIFCTFTCQHLSLTSQCRGKTAPYPPVGGATIRRAPQYIWY